MAGETLKTGAVCLGIFPWSRTSHVVSWLTPSGKVSTAVKGAVRPKSFFLGQYDLNYTCELVYYRRARNNLHALRECSPVEMRENLRGDWRRLVMAEHFRAVASDLCPSGPDAAEWFTLLDTSLDRLDAGTADLPSLLEFEISALSLAGLSPSVEAGSGSFALKGERRLPVSPQVAQCIGNPSAETDSGVLSDAARAVGVFYAFHLDGVPESRRTLASFLFNKQAQ